MGKSNGGSRGTPRSNEGSKGRKAVFAIFAVALMAAVPLSFVEDGMVSANGTDMVMPANEDYGFILTTSTIVYGGVSGQTISKVEHVDKDGHVTVIYGTNTLTNQLYQKSGNTITKRTDTPLTEDDGLLSFSSVTGLGPFNCFYAAINIGNTSAATGKSSTADGDIAYILDPNNLKRAIVGGTGDSVTGPYHGGTTNVTYYDIPDLQNYNILLVIPTVYWHAVDVTGEGDIVNRLYLSNKKGFFDDSTYHIDSEDMLARAHTIDGRVRPYLALGVYEASQLGTGDSSKLVSQSGQTPVREKSLSTFRDWADNLNGQDNGEYMIWNYYQWTLYKMMAYTAIGTKNSQLAIGTGITNDGNFLSHITPTGQGDTSGAYWGGVLFGSTTTGSYDNKKCGVKLFLENAWGSLHDQLDDVWLFDGQLHAGQNSIGAIRQNVNLNASYSDGGVMKTGSDLGLNDNQARIEGAVMSFNGNVKRIVTTYNDPDYWDLPRTFVGSSTAYDGTGSGLQYSPGNQTVCVGGMYSSLDLSGVGRVNVRNSYMQTGKYDIGTRLAYVFDGGVVEFQDGEYKISTPSGDITSGSPVREGTTVTVQATGAEAVTRVLMNDQELVGDNGVFTFHMPAGNAVLVVSVGNRLTDPYITDYVYDGKTHTVIQNLEAMFTVSGTVSAKDAGNYSFTLTPKAGYTWSNGGTAAKQFNWTIERAVLLVEGASHAEITKVYNGNKNLGPDGIDVDDLFFHGLADGEHPIMTYTAVYDNANAATNKKINVTNLSLQQSSTFNPANYNYAASMNFTITGVGVSITPLSLNSGTVNITSIPDEVFDGTAKTPSPRSSSPTRQSTTATPRP